MPGATHGPVARVRKSRLSWRVSFNVSGREQAESACGPVALTAARWRLLYHSAHLSTGAAPMKLSMNASPRVKYALAILIAVTAAYALPQAQTAARKPIS